MCTRETGDVGPLRHRSYPECPDDASAPHSRMKKVPSSRRPCVVFHGFIACVADLLQIAAFMQRSKLGSTASLRLGGLFAECAFVPRFCVRNGEPVVPSQTLQHRLNTPHCGGRAKPRRCEGPMEWLRDGGPRRRPFAPAAPLGREPRLSAAARPSATAD